VVVKGEEKMSDNGHVPGIEGIGVTVPVRPLLVIAVDPGGKVILQTALKKEDVVNVLIDVLKSVVNSGEKSRVIA